MPEIDRASPPVAIGIAGGSCSGKSTLSEALFKALGPQRAVMLPQDDYFYGLSDAPSGEGGANFDHPRAVRFALLAEQLAELKAGQAIERPLYDFTRHMPREQTERTEPRDVVIVDGILILHYPELRALLDFSVFVRADRDVRFERRMQRDITERARTPDDITRQFNDQVEPMHREFVEPSALHADWVIDNHEEDPAWGPRLAADIIRRVAIAA